MTNQDVYPLIAAACNAAGHAAEVTDKKLYILGIEMGWFIDVKKQHPKDLYLSRRQAETNPKYYISIGSIGERSTHRQKTDGSFNWDGISEKLVLIAEGRLRRNQREDTAKTNSAVAAETCAKLGVNSYSGPMYIRASEYKTDIPLIVKIEISTSATPERAEEIYAGLVALGLIAPKS